MSEKADSQIAQAELIGTFRLVSSTRQILDTGEVVDTYGANPKGYITYGGDGRMLAVIVRSDRTKPASLDGLTDKARANLFNSMLAYGGTYTFRGDRVEHHIDISSNEVWTGTTVVRNVRKEGDKLIYTTVPAPFSGDGKMSIGVLTWERVK